MQRPDIRSTIKDEARNITYHIMAYRALSKDEMVIAVRTLLAQPKRPALVDGQTIVIETLYRA